MTILLHPHAGGVNQALGPIEEYRTPAAFLTAVQRMFPDLRNVTKNDVTFYLCEKSEENSAAFKRFAAYCGWEKIYAVSIEKMIGGVAVHIPVGYSNKELP